MSAPVPDQDPLLSQLKDLIADKFQFTAAQLSMITSDEPLIGSRLGLDFVDALELGTYVEEEFGVTIGSDAESRAALASVARLADFIRNHAPDYAVASPTPRPLPWPALSSSRPTTVASGIVRFAAGVVRL